MVSGRDRRFGIIDECYVERAVVGIDRSGDLICFLRGGEETDEATRSFRTGYGNGDLGPDRCCLLGVSVLATTAPVL